MLVFSFTEKGNDKNKKENDKNELLTASCSANCLFSKCQATCTGNTTATCNCHFGFAHCNCGGGAGAIGVGGEVNGPSDVVISADNTQQATANAFISLLSGFNSQEANKVANDVRVAENQVNNKNASAYDEAVKRYENDLQALSPTEKAAVNKFFDEQGESHGQRL